MKKLLSALLCLTLLLSATSCLAKRQPPPEDPKPEPTVSEIYDGLIAQYTALLKAKQNGEELSAPNTEGMNEREATIAKTLYGIVVTCWKNEESAKNLGYGFKDMDGNGIPELILLTQHTTIMAIFTVSDNQPILLEANYGEKSSFVFATKNRLFLRRQTQPEPIGEATYYTCRVDGDKMVYDAIYGEVYDLNKKEILEYFQMVDGERKLIDKETFDDLYWEYGQTRLAGYNITSKRFAPRIHLPLVENKSSEGLPAADFSSYEAIRETCKAISTCLDKFETSKFFMGEYDDLFAFTSDLDFEYYISFLYSAYRGSGYTGYDEIDLNGDGEDELVLLNEDYSIKAIFTQKDGTPVLLDAFNDEICWLDDQGLVHVDRNDYNELEYSVYEFTKSGEYNLVYSILAAGNGNRYFTKDGKTELISLEKSLELYYDGYCLYPEYDEPNEHTRNVSLLNYTPLDKVSDDFVQNAVGKTWHRHANLEKTTGKLLACSNTYVTFENVTDAQMDVNFKYAFTYYYPDPNKDNYLLDDTTETFLKVTARAQDGAYLFDENGVKGRMEFGGKYFWIIIEESTDERFPVGAQCYRDYEANNSIIK